jgi:hypothetical protein
MSRGAAQQSQVKFSEITVKTFDYVIPSYGNGASANPWGHNCNKCIGYGNEWYSAHAGSSIHVRTNS